MVERCSSKYITIRERIFGVKCPDCYTKMQRVEYPFEPVWICPSCAHKLFFKPKENKK